MSLHPYASGNIAAARRDIAKCVELLRAAIKTNDIQESWKHIGAALGYAAQVGAQLDDAVTLEEMAVTAGEVGGE